MFFFKKFKKNEEEIKEIYSIIENQRSVIDVFLIRVQAIESKMSKISRDIIEIDDCDQHRQESINLISEKIESIQEWKDEKIIDESEIRDEISSILKMQKLISTWIVVLCATSIFSALLYFGII
jgi:chromosome segregation ATPase